jgi:Lhr-like helicase
MERLDHLTADQPIQRIGLSATQRPLERIGQFLVGAGRDCEIVDASEPKQLDLEIVVPVEDMVEPSPLGNKRRDGADTGKTPPPNLEHSPERIDPGPIEASLDPATNTRSIWPAIYPELLRLVREHNSTIVFVNNRRAAERIAKRLNEMHNDESWRRSCRPPSTPATRRTETRRRPRSHGHTTAPSPTRSGRWSRSCSSRVSCPAWSPPPRSSSASTWEPWTSSSRSSRRSR